MGRLNRTAYERLIAENIEWLLKQPRTLERDHIECILRNSPDKEYPAVGSPERIERGGVVMPGVLSGCAVRAANQMLSGDEELYLCIADGEGTHVVSVCSSKEQVEDFYRQTFGLDADGTIDGHIRAFADPDNWRNGGTHYHEELYCATLTVLKVQAKELWLAAAKEQRNG